MARQRSYDRQEAVERACRAFWEHGFQALGVREIEQLTGLNQYAIRSEFGGKEGLYLEALKFYSDAAIATALAPLNGGGLAEILAFLENLVADGSMTSSPWGCLIVNTGVENARVRSKKLEAAANMYWDVLESHFRQSLENACARGEIAPDLDCGATAKGLVTAVMGVHVRNRCARAHDGGQELVGLVCSHLNSLATP
jgi:AcrR family transcriptional regulator